MRDKAGRKYKCVDAKTRFYELGKTYTLVERGGKLGFVASDGMFDELGKTLSKFVVEKMEEESNE